MQAKETNFDVRLSFINNYILKLVPLWFARVSRFLQQTKPEKGLMFSRVTPSWVSRANLLVLRFCSTTQWYYPSGSRRATVVRALTTRQRALCTISARVHMWVDFVFGCSLASSVFFWFLRFSFLLKTNIYKLLFDYDRGLTWKLAKVGVTFSLYV